MAVQASYLDCAASHRKLQCSLFQCLLKALGCVCSLLAYQLEYGRVQAACRLWPYSPLNCSTGLASSIPLM